MFCRSCGTENPEGARFCKSCGQTVGDAQPSSGTETIPAAVIPAPAYAAVKPQRNMKPLIFALAALAVVVVVVVVLVLTLAGGDGSVVGVYREVDGESSLELKSDGTFTVGGDDSFFALEGTYEVNGDKLTLSMDVFGFETEMEGTVKGGKVTIEGTAYVKE